MDQRDGKRLDIIEGGVTVADSDREGIHGQCVAGARCPGQHTRVRIDRGFVRRPRFKAIDQRIGGKVRINGPDGNGKRITPVDHLIVDSLDDRRQIDFVDGNHERFRIAERCVDVVGQTDGESVFSRALGFGGRPSEEPAVPVDRGSGRRAGLQTEREAVRRIVRTGGGGGERKLRQFIHRSIGNGVEHGRFHGHPEPGDVGHRRRTVVGHANGYTVGAECLLGRRGPGQQAAGRVEVHSGRCPRFERERERVGRQVGVGSGDG